MRFKLFVSFYRFSVVRLEQQRTREKKKEKEEYTNNTRKLQDANSKEC